MFLWLTWMLWKRRHPEPPPICCPACAIEHCQARQRFRSPIWQLCPAHRVCAQMLLRADGYDKDVLLDWYKYAVARYAPQEWRA